MNRARVPYFCYFRLSFSCMILAFSQHERGGQYDDGRKMKNEGQGP